MGMIAALGGVVVIGHRPFRRVAIKEQQRPMAAAPSPSSSFTGRKKEAGGIVTIAVIDDPLQVFQEDVLVQGPAQHMSCRGIHEPHSGCQIRIVSLQLLLQK
ncbi:hypothetical protein QA635_32225 [Bradyrhizobium brasilense]|uniref:hypothetical protein n=1 Tax=Bradyrhizobium brasilense TaxID=1419277 RepID=UPI0024B2065C|nr:hypothetical protein [Bradyrhizobium australafricanum]WFU31196.1 hypothetical protein QA635_32225 [Bradyrhizobium australafricanum]